MRIQHNITALNAHRNLSNNNSAVGKNLEKLSSGYRINRAGDDAAGLAISEKMRAQITGLQTAQKNAEDGVSLVQTAEGALTEVHSMLNRMVELATQAANGTYSDANRQEMQKEITALNSEIDRISNTSNFNGTNLFGGAGAGGVKLYEAKDVMIEGKPVNGADQTETAAKFEAGKWTAGTNTKNDAKFEMTVTDADGTTFDFNIELKNGEADKAIADLVTELNKNADLQAHGITAKDDGKGNLVFESDDKGSAASRVTKATFTAGTSNATLPAGKGATEGQDAGKSYDLSGTMQAGDKLTVNGKTYIWDQNGDGKDGEKFQDIDTLKVALEQNGMTLVNQGGNGDKVVFKEKADANGNKGGVNITLHVGESSSEANGIVVNIKSMSTKSLGIDGVNITTADGAKAAIDTINAAIDDVSSIRSDLGALQNRLEHTINNLGVQTENITAAESRIRDVDMAKEMMAYTKNNILVQASQAMLAQANQVPQGVLQLLQ